MIHPPVAKATAPISNALYSHAAGESPALSAFALLLSPVFGGSGAILIVGVAEGTEVGGTGVDVGIAVTVGGTDVGVAVAVGHAVPALALAVLGSRVPALNKIAELVIWTQAAPI